MRENADHKNSAYGHFLRSDCSKVFEEQQIEKILDRNLHHKRVNILLMLRQLTESKMDVFSDNMFNVLQLTKLTILAKSFIVDV